MLFRLCVRLCQVGLNFNQKDQNDCNFFFLRYEYKIHVFIYFLTHQKNKQLKVHVEKDYYIGAEFIAWREGYTKHGSSKIPPPCGSVLQT